MNENTTPMKAIITIVVLVLLLVIIFWAVRSSDTTTDTTEVDTQTLDSTGDLPVITEVDLAAATTNEERLPAGFPADLPVEYDALTSSINASYGSEDIDEGVLQYESQSSIATVRSEYEGYMDDKGYSYTTKEFEGGQLVQVRGLADGKVLSVVIENFDNDMTSVTVSYSQSPNAVR